MKRFISYLQTRLYAFVPLANYEGSSLLKSSFDSQNLSQYLNSAFKIALVAAAMLAAGRITYAGRLYMTSDVWTNKEKAKSVLTDAIVGLIILLGIYLILGQINPDLLNLNVNNIVAPADYVPTQNPTLIPSSFTGEGSAPY